MNVKKIVATVVGFLAVGNALGSELKAEHKTGPYLRSREAEHLEYSMSDILDALKAPHALSDDHVDALSLNRRLTAVNVTGAPSSLPTSMPSSYPTTSRTDNDVHQETLAEMFTPTGDAHSMIMFGYGVVSTLLAGVGLFACTKGCAGKSIQNNSNKVFGNKM